jgi:hypothetical protein
MVNTRSVCTASSIRRRSAAWTILLDWTYRSRRRAPRALSTEQRARFGRLSGGLGGLELPTKRLSVASSEQPPSLAGSRMAWASLASPTCRRNGAGSTSCSAFPRSNRTHTRTESLGSGLCARKRNFCGRDEAAETVSLKFNWPFAEKRAHTRQPRSFGHFARSGPLVNPRSQRLIMVWLQVRVLPACDGGS